jgi:hypothetical protein
LVLYQALGHCHAAVVRKKCLGMWAAASTVRAQTEKGKAPPEFSGLPINPCCALPRIALLMPLGVAQGGVQELTTDVSSLVNLVHLDCNVTRRMQSIPDSISCLQMLTYLHVRGLFTDVGGGLPTLRKLAKLCLNSLHNIQLSDNLQVPHQLHIGSCVQKTAQQSLTPQNKSALDVCRSQLSYVHDL